VEEVFAALARLLKERVIDRKLAQEADEKGSVQLEKSPGSKLQERCCQS
jgi:hypothetical protein